MISVGTIMLATTMASEATLTVRDLEEGPPAFDATEPLSETPYPPDAAVAFNRQALRAILHKAKDRLLPGEYPATLTLADRVEDDQDHDVVLLIWGGDTSLLEPDHRTTIVTTGQAWPPDPDMFDTLP